MCTLEEFAFLNANYFAADTSVTRMPHDTYKFESSISLQYYYLLSPYPSREHKPQSRHCSCEYQFCKGDCSIVVGTTKRFGL